MSTPAATLPNASASASSPNSRNCGWPRGRTCPASAATSPQEPRLLRHPRLTPRRPVPHRQHRRRNSAGTSRSPQAPGRGAAESRSRVARCHDYVFSTAWGEPIHPDTVSSLMTTLVNTRNAQRSEPLPHARLHDLRHVHATPLLLAGVTVHVVAARLGHADPRSHCAFTPTSSAISSPRPPTSSPAPSRPPAKAPLLQTALAKEPLP